MTIMAAFGVILAVLCSVGTYFAITRRLRREISAEYFWAAMVILFVVQIIGWRLFIVNGGLG
jgi:hypothetical protein